MLLLVLGCYLAGYLIGSIPFGVLWGKALAGIDPQAGGSQNIGATNVARLAGWRVGLLVLLCDGLKGYLPVFLSHHFLVSLYGVMAAFYGVLGAGLGAFSGHLHSIFLKHWKGGKGVATALGVFFALYPVPTAAALVLWTINVTFFRYVSLSTLLTCLAYPFLFLLWRSHFQTQATPLQQKQTQSFLIFSTLIVLWIMIKHTPNIVRLCQGKEFKLGQRPDVKENSEKS